MPTFVIVLFYFNFFLLFDSCITIKSYSVIEGMRLQSYIINFRAN